MYYFSLSRIIHKYGVTNTFPIHLRSKVLPILQYSSHDCKGTSITLLHPSVFVLIVLRFIHSFIEYLQLCKNAGIYNMSLETSFQEDLLILLPIIHSFMFLVHVLRKVFQDILSFFLIKHHFTNCQQQAFLNKFWVEIKDKDCVMQNLFY